MNLFDSIGLDADPFSTSPNVDLFYPAVEHRQCLEGLELAIRMRRGLSVVRGGIGVGKPTISRKLIQNFKDESDDFDFLSFSKNVAYLSQSPFILQYSVFENICNPKQIPKVGFPLEIKVLSGSNKLFDFK